MSHITFIQDRRPEGAAVPARVVPAWHPIETAPRDRPVLVVTPRWGVIVAEFRSGPDAWFSRMQCPVSLTTGEDEPSHWMPLPAAPAAAAPKPRPRASEPRRPALLSRLFA